MSAGASSSSSLPEFGLQGVDDVEDFSSESEGDPSMSFERFSHLQDLVRMGNNAFREHRLDEAIDFYTRASNIKPNDAIILGNRCVSFLRFSQFLKNRSSSDSEARPLIGLDPTTHAGLALRDAEKVVSLQSSSVKSYILKANALVLLDKYELAQDVIYSGLHIDPLSISLQNLARCTNEGRRSHGKPQRSDDFDCTLCLKLLYEPITTPCGHSFCRSCLFQSMDRCNRCPLCRTVLFLSTRNCAISVTLNNIIQKNFPEEYAERKTENDGLINFGVDLLPLFVLDAILPCQKIQLNIFEPRYKLMVRRIMEGNRRMGMAFVDSATGSIAEYGCEVEITDCEPLPDGQFILEVESRRRCRIVRNWDQDGYRVAEVEWVHDVCPAEGSRERHELQEMINSTSAYALEWLHKAQQAARRDRVRLAELYRAEALMPSTQDPERFSFWLSTLTNRRPLERLELLKLRDTDERIRRALIYMNEDGHGVVQKFLFNVISRLNSPLS